MVEGMIRAINPRAGFKSVHASRGKVMGAEPIAAMREHKMVDHVGGCGTPNIRYAASPATLIAYRVDYSPNRATHWFGR
jgi:phage terminase large subunit-like protein